MGLHVRVMRVEVRGEPEGATGDAVGTVDGNRQHRLVLCALVEWEDSGALIFKPGHHVGLV